MRIVSIVFYVLALLAALAWAYWYVWIGSMACAFSGPVAGRNCTLPLPWQLSNAEDILFLVVIPGGVTLFLALMGWLAGRSARASRD